MAHRISASNVLMLSLLLLCSTVMESGSAAAAPAASSTAPSPPATPGQSPEACGATIEDNLAAAQRAVQSDDKATRAALVCLIEATAALNRQVQNLDQGRSPAGALRVPAMTFPPAPGQ
jgi:hypothetical protein